MTRRNRSQMTFEAFEEEQQTLGDGWADEEADEAARLVGELEQPEPRFVDDDTTPAVAPRGALDLLRQMEAAA